MADCTKPTVGLTRRSMLACSLGVGLAGLMAACTAAPAPTPATAPPAQPSSPPPSSTQSTPAAAAPTAAPKPAATSAPAAAKATVKWKHALVPLLIDSAFMVLGKEKGYYAEQGVDIDFPVIPDGNTATKAIVAGELDSSGSSVGAVFVAISQGASLKFIGSHYPKVTTYLYGKQDIKSLSDLYGRSVGVAAPGAFLHLLASGAMKAQGLDPDKVSWVNVGASPDIWNALVAGKIDAGVGTMDVLPELPKYANLHVVVSFAEALPNYLRDAYQMTDKLLTDRRDEAIRVFTAMTKSVRYALENKDDFVALAAKMTGQNAANAAFIHEQYYKNRLIDPNLRLSPDSVAFTQKFTVDAGQLKEPVPYDKVVTDDIAKTVIANLGEWKFK